MADDSEPVFNVDAGATEIKAPEGVRRSPQPPRKLDTLQHILDEAYDLHTRGLLHGETIRTLSSMLDRAEAQAYLDSIPDWNGRSGIAANRCIITHIRRQFLRAALALEPAT